MSKGVRDEKVKVRPGFYGLDVEKKWETIDRIMKDAVECHCNMGQDYNNYQPTVPKPRMTEADRPYDDVNIAKEASKAGMKAIVFTCHSGQSFFRAPVIQKVVNEWAETCNVRPVKVIGTVTLNYVNGGLNAELVRMLARFGGKVVLMPTWDGAHGMKVMGQKGGIELTKNGKVVPPLEEIIGIMADNDLVLDTTWASIEDKFILLDEGKKAGIKRFFVYNPGPAGGAIGATEEQWIKLTKNGVKLQATANTLMAKERFDLQQNLIKKAGVDAFVSGTDLNGWGGQLLHPVDGLKKYAARLLFDGMTESDVEKIYQTNPAKLLGL